MEEKVLRLQFLQDILDAQDVSKRDLAALMGVTPQNIFTYFKRDDMRLSVAMEIAEKLGYDLAFSLNKPGRVSASKAALQIESLLGNAVGATKVNRLAFLSIAMKLYGIERKDLAEKLDLAYNGINRWFKVDDISISYLYQIADIYGLNFTVKPEAKIKGRKKKAAPAPAPVDSNRIRLK